MSGLCHIASCFQFYFFILSTYSTLHRYTTLCSQSFSNNLLRLCGSYQKKAWFLRNPDSSVGKESACNAGDPGCSIPGSGRSPGEGIGYSLQYSWASLAAQLVKSLQCGRPGFDPWVGKISWRRQRLPTPVFWPGEFQGLYSPWARRVGHSWATFTFTSRSFKRWEIDKENNISMTDLN